MLSVVGIDSIENRAIYMVRSCFLVGVFYLLIVDAPKTSAPSLLVLVGATACNSERRRIIEALCESSVLVSPVARPSAPPRASCKGRLEQRLRRAPKVPHPEHGVHARSGGMEATRAGAAVHEAGGRIGTSRYSGTSADKPGFHSTLWCPRAAVPHLV